MDHAMKCPNPVQAIAYRGEESVLLQMFSPTTTSAHVTRVIILVVLSAVATMGGTGHRAP